jgi:hypothetical protein
MRSMKPCVIAGVAWTWAIALPQGFDFGQQLVGIDRFGDVVTRPLAHAPHTIRFQILAGAHDDGHICKCRIKINSGFSSESFLNASSAFSALRTAKPFFVSKSLRYMISVLESSTIKTL